MRAIITLIFFSFFAFYTNAQVFRYDPGKLKVEWQIVENGYQGKPGFLSALSFTNTASRPFPPGWSIYFNLARNINEVLSPEVKIEHVNGDLFRLFPAASFRNLAPGQTLRVEFVASDWAVNSTDAPLGLYLVWDKKPETGIPLIHYAIKPSSEPKQFLRSKEDKISFVTPEWRYQQNKNFRDIEEKELVKIFPTPRFYEEKSGLFVITTSTVIDADPAFTKLAGYLAGEFVFLIGQKLSMIGNKTENRNTIFLKKNSLPEGEYTLSVNTARIEISASSGVGIFYGIQSLKTLIAPGNLVVVQRFIPVTAVEVRDSPRFGYRGFMLDVARNFQSKEEILKLIDLMALYKLNVFHFHFSDDEGWRIEIPGLYELTEIGSNRGHSAGFKEFLMPSYGSGPDVLTSYGSGFYSRKEFIEILRYAQDRYIQVIPEIETPGHARAAVVAMRARYDKLMAQGKSESAEKYLLQDLRDESVYKSVQGWRDNVIDVGLPSTYVFLDKVITELQAMYKEAGAALTTIHMGGDEVPAGVWEKSPACKLLMESNPELKSENDLWFYFYDKIHKLLQSKGLKLYGWEEVVLRKTLVNGSTVFIPNPELVGKNIKVDVWNNVLGWGSEDLAYRLANAGFKVVLSNSSHLYFDFAYYKAFEEPGYYWGGYVDVDKPFSFIPFDYYKNTVEDRNGNPLNKNTFLGKDRLTDYGKQNIVGIQGLLWSENIRGKDRLEYQLLPKLLGLAERSWAADPAWAMQEDSSKALSLYREAWSHFVNVLGKRELPRLDNYYYGFNYRIPPVGISRENGLVHVNHQFPGFVIRYTTDGKEPTVKSNLYTQPIEEKGTIKFKAFSLKGRMSKTVVVKND